MPPAHPAAASSTAIQDAADAIGADAKVTLLVGCGARGARDEVLSLAETLAAPMVLTLKAKEGLEHDNPYAVGQTGLIGNPAATAAMDDADVLVLVGTDFPYRDWIPTGKTVIQLDSRAEHVGRRTAVTHALVGDARATLRTLLPLLSSREPGRHLQKAQERYDEWMQAQRQLAEPGHDESLLGRLRSKVDNPDELIRPEAVAVAVDRARRARHDLHERHRHVDGVAGAARADEQRPTAGRLVQPRVDGQRHADGARERRPSTATVRSSRSAATVG